MNQEKENQIDFWEEANQFLKSQLPVDFKQNLSKHIKNKGFNHRESKLLKSNLLAYMELLCQ